MATVASQQLCEQEKKLWANRLSAASENSMVVLCGWFTAEEYSVPL